MYVAAMLALAKLAEPGPFVKNNNNFGSFGGILKDGDLVAMGAGRLQLPCENNKFSEVTSKCVHPEYCYYQLSRMGLLFESNKAVFGHLLI